MSKVKVELIGDDIPIVMVPGAEPHQHGRDIKPRYLTTLGEEFKLESKVELDEHNEVLCAVTCMCTPLIDHSLVTFAASNSSVAAVSEYTLEFTPVKNHTIVMFVTENLQIQKDCGTIPLCIQR